MAITVNINISKAKVMEEVAKTTGYIGQKAVSGEDPAAYNRIAVIDANREQLDRYWMEACSAMTTLLGHDLTDAESQVLPASGTNNTNYRVKLRLPSNWNSALRDALSEHVMSYLVNAISSRWLMMTQKADAEPYAVLSGGSAGQVRTILLTRKRPTRRAASGGGEETGLWVGTDLWIGQNTWIGQ